VLAALWVRENPDDPNIPAELLPPPPPPQYVLPASLPAGAAGAPGYNLAGLVPPAVQSMGPSASPGAGADAGAAPPSAEAAEVVVLGAVARGVV
jgi:hypothetical protein